MLKKQYLYISISINTTKNIVTTNKRKEIRVKTLENTRKILHRITLINNRPENVSNWFKLNGEKLQAIRHILEKRLVI